MMSGGVPGPPGMTMRMLRDGYDCAAPPPQAMPDAMTASKSAGRKRLMVLIVMSSPAGGFYWSGFSGRFLRLGPSHDVTGRDHGAGRAQSVVRVTHLDPVRRQDIHMEIAVGIDADDGLVVARNRPPKRFVGGRSRGQRVPPGEPSVLPVDHEGELEVTHARRTGGRLRARMVRVGAENDRLPLARPGAFDIRDRILRAR